MKSSVYQIVGCAGSMRYREVENCLDAKTARQHAAKRNHNNADKRGVSYREYMNDWSNLEGQYTSFKTGSDGVAI